MIKEITEYILNDFDRSAVEKQPKKAAVCVIIEKMRLILFPECFGSGVHDTEYGLGHALEEVYAELKSQGVPAEKAESFMRKIPSLRECLKTDVEAAYEGDPAACSKAEIIISYPGLFAAMVQRIAHELYLLNVPMIPRIMTEYAHSITGIDIHPGASIGNYFFIDHGTGVVIGETTTIGNHVKIYQGVTLGALSTRGGQKLRGVKRHPTLEDYVTVYSGASILGGETVIGKNVTIGSNAFVIKSVPTQTRVSVKNPELQFKNGDKKETSCIELEQNEFWDFVI
ncbi:MAG: serine acetyltransferase [Oscillospiraceae bacterium]|nr:serine acetyltransferase [Oscillospiraceae bacterium]